MQGSVRFQREPLTQALWDEALPLLFAHWKEVAHFPDVELTPDLDRYALLERNGVIRVYTARTEKWLTQGVWRNGGWDERTEMGGHLVGYALFVVTPSMHYRQMMQAVEDVIYVQPDQRGTMPIRFIQFCTDELFKDGADLVVHHMKNAHSFARILERQGFDLVDLIYVKRNPAWVPTSPAAVMASAESHG